MGEKGTPHTRISAAALVRRAKDEGRLAELADGVVDAHQLNGAGKKHKPFSVLRPETQDLTEGELRKYNAAAKKHLGAAGGYVDLTEAPADPVIQSLAERVGQLVSSIVRFNLPEERRKRVLQEIEDDFRKRNPE